MVRVIRTIGPYTFVGEESMINAGKENPPYLGEQSAQLGHKKAK